jgi:hypothetical protein
MSQTESDFESWLAYFKLLIEIAKETDTESND